jgi:hypothetical protein
MEIGALNAAENTRFRKLFSEWFGFGKYKIKQWLIKHVDVIDGCK